MLSGQGYLLLKVIRSIGRNSLGITTELWNPMSFKISMSVSSSDEIGKKLKTNQNASLASLIGDSSTGLSTLAMLDDLSSLS